MCAAILKEHQHGKSRVRLGRTWREGDVHHFVEWTVHTMLESDMAHAFLDGSNTDMTATDTQKNTVYYIAKQCNKRCSPEEYAIALARHFVATYPKVSKAKVWVEQAPWERCQVDGQPHNHGFAHTGAEIRTTFVTADDQGNTAVTAGLKGYKVLKTTQSGYEGYLHDQYTLLPETRDRIMATSIAATWKYSGPVNYDAAYAAVKEALQTAFWGPPKSGVYSPSVQYTLFQMGKLALARAPQVESIYLNMPNLHFLPCNTVTSKFEDDVYIATSEPHGNIEATITRGDIEPHCKL
ncbi:urate oxidase II [Coccomyxa subellipsoidea C-169]|uniref:Uricase n=1 Tax=Coccomyxa subellipsoidea (strain C-169) TaxID=574566 RepID=I0Z7F3_COCSC|nr:urate oxidase II [Coccomyxa subellipsoidea C-169]EIE26572.1 urate oxidase II [Coccomyxa subellipsoidea C-169]|eukprot:XP_005651116.1 urate oxidase II [Coccomyxa subellipsoidea C-169]